MPTARPIIIEKFIDHTDIGVTHESTWSRAKPTAMPATASSSGMPAAISAPKAMNSMIRVGRPLTSSALWRASSFILLKSLHTGHSPVTSAWAPSATSRVPTKSPSSPAASGRSASSPICCSTGISAVVPSWEIIPASGGMVVGSTTDTTFGPPCELGHDGGHAARVVARSACPGGRRRSGSRRRGRGSRCAARHGPSRRSSPWRPSPAPDSAPVRERASGAAASVTASHTRITALRWRAIDAARRENSARSSGSCDGSWPAKTVSVTDLATGAPGSASWSGEHTPGGIRDATPRGMRGSHRRGWAAAVPGGMLPNTPWGTTPLRQELPWNCPTPSPTT